MRTFVMLLVVANLAYFVWAGWLREQPVRPATPPTADGLPPFEPAPEGLTLLSELPDAETEAALPAPPETGAEPGLPEPELDDNVALVETESPALAAEEPEAPAPDPAILPAGPAWCAELGLFSDLAAAEALVPELLLLGVDADLVSGRRAAGVTHWVHSRLFASEDAARELLAELQGRNIDSFYMRDGDLAGRISLGVFSRADSAQRMQDTLREQGYEAEISQVTRQEERYWLELRSPSRAVLETGDWAALAGRLELPEAASGSLPAEGLGLAEKVCDPVASTTQFP